MTRVDGQRLVAGRYRLLSPLGVGGMGTVWRAEDVLLGREVAVKEVTFPQGLSDEDCDVLRERTRREARAAARLDHPSAVTVYDVVEDGGSPFLVMELVEARTLAQVVRLDGPLDHRRTAEVGLALLGALETAHRQGVVHRDVKPGNVLLTEPTGDGPGRVVLTDFGIASSHGDSSITSTGLLLGSPSYIAPERARGLAPAPASDLWSLGATLFTAVEGRPPYDAGDPLLTVTAVVTGEHEPFVAAGPLEPVITGLLARDPADRMSVAQARAALLPIASAAPTPDAPPTRRPRRDRAAVDAAGRTTALPVADLDAATGGGGASGSGSGSANATGPLMPRPERPWSADPVVTPRRRRSRAPLVALAAVLVAGAGVGGFALSGDPDTPPAAAAGSSPDPSTPASPEASASPEAGAPLPEGWTRYTDPVEGWTVGVPPGFEQSTRGQLVQFRDDDARRTLRIDRLAAPASALQARQAFSPQLAGALTDYREIRVEPVEFKGLDAAELEFTYSDSGAQLQVVDRLLVTEDGEQALSLYWQVNTDDFAASLEQFEQIAATFEPGDAAQG